MSERPRKFGSLWAKDAEARVTPEAPRQMSPQEPDDARPVKLVAIDVSVVDLIILNFKLLIAAMPVAAVIFFVLLLIRSALNS